MAGKIEIFNEDFGNIHFKDFTNDNKLKKYEISYLALGNSLIENCTFEQSYGYELGMKEAELRNTQILQCKIDSCYLRHAKLNDCKFIGTKIINSNMEKTEISCCDFSYTQFENSILNIDELLRNSPKAPNLKLFFLKQLYRNELQMGNSDQYDKLLFLIRETEKEISKKLWMNKDPYFKNISKKKHIAFFHWILYLISGKLFGYGLIFYRILLSYIVWIIFFASIYFFSFRIPWGNSLEYSIQNAILSNISISNIGTDSVIRFVSYIQNFLGVIYTAVLTSAFYRRIAR